MDTETESVIKFLGGVVAAQKSLLEFCRRLQQLPDIRKAAVYLFSPGRATRYDETMNETLTIGSDFGVSAEMADGAVVDWWLEVWHDGQTWHISYNVYRSDAGEDGSHIAVAFSERRAGTTDAFLISLVEAAQELAEVKPSTVAGTPEP